MRSSVMTGSGRNGHWYWAGGGPCSQGHHVAPLTGGRVDERVGFEEGITLRSSRLPIQQLAVRWSAAIQQRIAPDGA
jgi:hypothetical protein